MKKNKKVEELISSQVANAISEVANFKKEEKASKVKNTKKETPAPEVVATQEETPKATLKKKATKSKKEEVTKEVTKQQNAAIVEKVVSNREVKYIYPEDVTDTLSRKRWRQQTRNELHRLERDMYRIKDSNSKEYKEAKAAYEAFMAKVLKPEQIA